MSNKLVRILGVDPGLRSTGWGVIESAGNSLVFIASGTIPTNAKIDLALRLNELYDGLEAVLREYAPQEAAVETTFVNRDAAATLKLGQARGIALLVPARAGIPVAEYAPNAVKKTVTGTGHGDKKQIQMMVRTLMPKADFSSEHAADALAVAICHGHMRGQAALARKLADSEK